MKSKLTYLVPVLVGLLTGCEFIKLKSTVQEDNSQIAVARVFDTYLYQHELAGIAPENLSEKDSAELVEKYVDGWIKKQLLIAKASSKIEFNEAEIDRKVLDYKFALMVHEYEKYEIGRNLKKDISDEEVQKYYNEKFENFLLKQNIVKCLFVKVPKNSPRLPNLKQLLEQFPNSDLEEIKSYCFRYAIQSSLEHNQWLNFDDVIKNTPLASISDKAEFLKANSFVETSDDESVYFIKLIEYKISDQVPPLEFIREDITNIILNKRKIELTKRLEEEIVNEAKRDNEFEIFK